MGECWSGASDSQCVPLSAPAPHTQHTLSRTILCRMLSDAFDSSGTTLPHCEGVSMATRPRPPVLHQTWSDHALPVSAVHCGAGGLRARVATASLDQTCRVRSGKILTLVLL